MTPLLSTFSAPSQQRDTDNEQNNRDQQGDQGEAQSEELLRPSAKMIQPRVRRFRSTRSHEVAEQARLTTAHPLDDLPIRHLLDLRNAGPTLSNELDAPALENPSRHTNYSRSVAEERAIFLLARSLPSKKESSADYT
jgi:hypothetical protein